VLGQLSIDMYSGEPLNTSTCIDIHIRGHNNNNNNNNYYYYYYYYYNYYALYRHHPPLPNGRRSNASD